LSGCWWLVVHGYQHSKHTHTHTWTRTHSMRSSPHIDKSMLVNKMFISLMWSCDWLNDWLLVEVPAFSWNIT
jgi:hypothetical protein